MPRPDDDALSWEGDDDPTLDPGAGTGTFAPRPADPVAAEPILDADMPTDDRLRPEPEGPAAPEDPVQPAPQRAGSDDAAVEESEPEPADRGGPGDAGLVVLGVLGGVYLLWTIGWVLGTLRLRDWIEIRTGAVADAMFHGSMALGILAPVLWFFGAWFLTRHHGGWVRVLALVLGAVVLVPWPFVMVGVVGQ